MQLKNNSARPYHVAMKLIAPGATVEVPDTAMADIKGIADLEVIKESAQVETVEFKEVEPEAKKPGRPAKSKEEA